jgi:hypothetical protein
MLSRGKREKKGEEGGFSLLGVTQYFAHGFCSQILG